MPDIMQIAEASMRANIEQLNTISRNVANANAQGYKREIYLNRGFDSLMQSQPYGSIQPSSEERHTTDVSVGSLKYTGSPLHLAIEGDGYFQLQSPQGIVLTRNGEFRIDRNGSLVSAQGWPVLLSGDVVLSDAQLRVSEAGAIQEQGKDVAQIELVKAPVASLQTVLPGVYRSNEATAMDSDAIRVRQGYLEGSNVNTLTEMVELMKAMRQMEASQQMLKAYDGLTDTAISTLGQF